MVRDQDPSRLAWRAAPAQRQDTPGQRATDNTGASGQAMAATTRRHERRPHAETPPPCDRASRRG
jgi:hypothetical protein